MNLVLTFLAFFLSAIFLFILVGSDKNQSIRFYVLMFISITVSNAGYLAMATAKDLNTAILANQISYLGGCFLPLFMLLVISSLCDIKIPKGVVISLCAYSMLVFSLTFTIGINKIYYSSVEIEQRNGVTYLIKEYGPTHILYIILLCSYVFASLSFILYSLVKKRNVSYKNLLSIFLAEALIMCVYVAERLFNAEFEWLAYACLIFEVVILVLIRRISMYDINCNVINAQNHAEKNAYVIFDKKLNFTGSNALAEKFFPELKKLKIDHGIDPEQQGYIYDHFIHWIESCMDKNAVDSPEKSIEGIHHIIRHGYNLKCTLKYLYHGRKNKLVGYLIEIVDDTEQQEYIHLINNYNTELETAVQEQIAHIQNMQDQMILGMANMVESRDDNTGEHIKRTREVVRILVEKLKKENLFDCLQDDLYCEYIVKAAPMHDLGKIIVADEILKKPGRYIPEEFELMKLHAAKGADIVETVLKDVEDEKFVKISKNIAHYHHEKWNGEGYPEGLVGENIPLEARIMALADVFDAIVSKRCYKESKPYHEAFMIIEQSLGTHFDPAIGKVFLQCKNKIEGYYHKTESMYE